MSAADTAPVLSFEDCRKLCVVLNTFKFFPCVGDDETHPTDATKIALINIEEAGSYVQFVDGQWEPVNTPSDTQS